MWLASIDNMTITETLASCNRTLDKFYTPSLRSERVQDQGTESTSQRQALFTQTQALTSQTEAPAVQSEGQSQQSGASDSFGTLPGQAVGFIWLDWAPSAQAEGFYWATRGLFWVSMACLGFYHSTLSAYYLSLSAQAGASIRQTVCIFLGLCFGL